MGMDFFSIMFFLVFVIVITMFIVILFRNISEWNRNNHSPVLDVAAAVVTKRISRHRSGDHSTTSHYVTFQVESGDRMEFHMTGREYGMLAEGDIGTLRFQGTRYLSFTRSREFHS